LDQDGIDGTVTQYMLDVAGIKFHWGWDFLHLYALALGLTQPPVKWYLVFPGVQQLGRGIGHPPIWRQGSRKSGAIPLLPLCAPSWPILAWTLLYLLLQSLIQFTPTHTPADNDTCLSKFDQHSMVEYCSYPSCYVAVSPGPVLIVQHWSRVHQTQCMMWKNFNYKQEHHGAFGSRKV
jgi:hypothetical protein